MAVIRIIFVYMSEGKSRMIWKRINIVKRLPRRNYLTGWVNQTVSVVKIHMQLIERKEGFGDGQIQQ